MKDAPLRVALARVPRASGAQTCAALVFLSARDALTILETLPLPLHRTFAVSHGAFIAPLAIDGRALLALSAQIEVGKV